MVHVLLSLLLTSTMSASDAKPNLVLILADDLGAKELGCYGHPRHRTPRLDELARTGVMAKTCYATPICHPTRFEIMTGQYGCHNGVYHFAGRAGGPEPDSPVEDIGANHHTFAEMLTSEGYRTVLAGKWQLSGVVPTLVHDTGFEHYLIWAYKHNLPPGVQHTGGWERLNGKTSRYWNPCLLRDGEYVPTKPDDYGPDLFTNYLVDYIKNAGEEPFFAYYSMALVHDPWLTTPDSSTSRQDRTAKSKDNFQANVEYVDKLVGRIVDALDEKGIRDNTIIIFTGDNGTGGDGKATYTELGARVPLIVNAPGIVKARGAVDDLVDFSDIYPTLAEFAGGKAPDDHQLDGKSFVPVLNGDTSEPHREWIFSYLGDRRIVRTTRWLLEDNSPHQKGRLYDCGDRRDGTGYRNVTKSTDPDVQQAFQKMISIAERFPAPDVEPGADQKRAKRKQSKQTANIE